jgi:hypothetical protein
MTTQKLGRLAARTGSVSAIGALSVALATGAAYAVWTSTGSGSGSAKASSMQGVTVTAGTAPSGQLYPGLVANGVSTGGDVVVNVDNANPFPVTVTLTSIGTVTGCTTPAVTLAVTTKSFTVPANTATAVQRSWDKVLSMGDSSNDCQSKALTIPVSFSVSS